MAASVASEWGAIRYAACFFFLRRTSQPKPARPLANSGAAAGSGVGAPVPATTNSLTEPRLVLLGPSNDSVIRNVSFAFMLNPSPGKKIKFSLF